MTTFDDYISSSLLSVDPVCNLHLNDLYKYKNDNFYTVGFLTFTHAASDSQTVGLQPFLHVDTAESFKADYIELLLKNAKSSIVKSVELMLVTHLVG